MDPLIIAALCGGAVLLIGFFTASVVVERADVRESLRRLEGYKIADVRDQEMLAPISERVFAPFVNGVSSAVGRFTPQGYREQVARKLTLAGNPGTLNVDQIVVLKLLGGLSILVWLPLIILLHLSGLLALAAVAFLWG